MKQLLQLLLLSSFAFNASSQSIFIPDEIFKNNLLQNGNINVNDDDEISEDEAAAYSGTINISGLGVSDLTGIEYFTELTRLAAFDNFLEHVDLSNNLFLDQLLLEDNLLRDTLNLSNNILLTDVKAHSNGELQYINIANGNNYEMTRFQVQDCFELVCVQVDDAAYSAVNWPDISNISAYNEDCGLNTSLKELETNASNIFPNPTTGKLEITFDHEVEAIEIYSFRGSKIRTINNMNQEINISDLDNGIYLINIIKSDSVSSHKIVKQ